MEENTDRIRLKEGEDYYLEDGLMVFTSSHHIKRGFCCKNTCRHCPYVSAKEKSRRTKNRE